MDWASHLKSSQPFVWRKMGLAADKPPQGFTHLSQPCIVHRRENEFVLAFTCRDDRMRSHIFLARTILTSGGLEQEEPRLALSPGGPGTFDCDGVISVCIVTDEARHYLYYVGWHNLKNTPWACDTGRAVLDLDELTLDKEFPGPVIGRNRHNPLFAAATAFHVENGIWRTWYNSGISWTWLGDRWHHHYGIHHAHSKDGIDWIYDPGLCLPFKDEYEYAFGRPSVIRRDGLYLMWFAHRASRDIQTYRIGFAWSEDGLAWNRADELSGIDVSPEGWDSEMICYPYVFDHAGRHYMLYNGNGYGRTGFGLAVLEEG